jgi:hypothetical protein
MKRPLFALIMFVCGCGPDSPEDSGGGEQTSAEGDGDGDGDAGDGDGDGDLESVCMTGCTYTFQCAPNEILTYYADVPECVSHCLILWGQCIPEGSAYLDCVLGLDCAEVVPLVADGPATSACGASFTAAQAACMGG